MEEKDEGGPEDQGEKDEDMEEEEEDLDGELRRALAVSQDPSRQHRSRRSRRRKDPSVVDPDPNKSESSLRDWRYNLLTLKWAADPANKEKNLGANKRQAFFDEARQFAIDVISSRSL
jgi:hypothetical protein